MPIAITEDHRTLGQTASDFLAKRDARGAARSLLEAELEGVPPFWSDLAELGWLGLHLPENRGGSGYGLPELVVVVEELGRAMAPGPFVPTVIASAVIQEAAPDDLAARLLPGLADGSALGGIALTSDITVTGGKAAGTAPAVLGGGLATLLVLPAGDDVIVVDATSPGVTVERAAQPRPHPPGGPGHARRAHRRRDCGRRPVARRPGPADHRRRGRRLGHRVHRTGRGLRQGPPSVRPAHCDVPGGQAPLRQHARRRRAGHGHRVGRGPGGRGGRRPASPTAPPWRPRWRWRRPTSAPT